MMKEIIFIDPRGYQLGLNTGLAYLCGRMEKEKIYASVIDFNNYGINEEDRLIEVRGVDFIGISVKTFTMPEVLRLIKAVKKINPHAPVIAGGIHIMVDGLKFMEDNPLIDIGIIGEGEEPLSRIIKGEPLSDIPGIIFRENGRVKMDSGENRLMDMDELLFPSYRYFDSCGYWRENYFPLSFYPLVTSKGCPYQCIFCAVPGIGGKKWRARSPEKLILELEKVKDDTGIKEFAIYDDNFTIDLSRAKRFCHLLIDKKIEMKWSCPNGIKADRLDRELVHLMRRSGCYAINIGIETGDEKVFKLIKKGGTLRNVEEAIKILKEEDMVVGGFFLVGLPGTNIKSDMASFYYARKLPLDFSAWSFLAPYPGTELYDMIQSGKFGASMLRDWRDGRDYQVNPHVVFETDEYNARDRRRMYNWANLRNRLYGALTDQNSSGFKKLRDLLCSIIKYDPWHLPQHIFNIISTAVKGIRGKASFAMLPSYYRKQKGMIKNGNK